MTPQILIPSEEKEFNSCLNIARRSPAKPCSAEGQSRHSLDNLWHLISCSLFFLPLVVWPDFPGLLLLLRLLGTESPLSGSHLQKRGFEKSKLYHDRSSLPDRKRTGHLALLGSWLWPLACLPWWFGILLEWAGHPAPSSHTQGQCEGHKPLFWIISMFRLPKSVLTGDTWYYKLEPDPHLNVKGRGIPFTAYEEWLNLPRSQGQ